MKNLITLLALLVSAPALAEVADDAFGGAGV